jgi:hypothetical protein
MKIMRARGFLHRGAAKFVIRGGHGKLQYFGVPAARVGERAAAPDCLTVRRVRD